MMTSLMGDTTMVKVSPLNVENLYYPLFYHDGKINIHRLVASISPPIVQLVPAPTRKVPT